MREILKAGQHKAITETEDQQRTESFDPFFVKTVFGAILSRHFSQLKVPMEPLEFTVYSLPLPENYNLRMFLFGT